MKTERLLVVEDHPDNLTVLVMMLEQKYEVMGHSSPERALEAVEGFRPHLLVLDVAMAPINGLECLKAIRQKSGFRNVPALALTAFAREEERIRFLAAGFQAVITKPVLDPDYLEFVIEELLKSPIRTLAS